MGVFPLAPVCTWSSVTTGVTFEYQIASTPAFTSISYSTSAVTGLTVGPLTSEQLPDNHTYYWRIRATSGTLNSNWSEIYAFRIEPPASAPVVRTLPTFDRFAVVGHLPRVGKGNFTTWPTCLVTFNTDIYAPSVSGGVVFNAVDVDTGAAVTLPTSALVVSGTTLTLSVTGDIAYNTRYITTIDEVMSSAGAILSEPVEISFTGPYLPMYVDATTLLSNNGEFGAFFARYTQEEINLQLHRASLKCNRLIDGDSTTPLSILRATKTATYAMLEYVSALTCYTLIQDFQYKLLMDSDRKMQIDTLIDNLGTDILKQISAILAKLKGDIDTYAMSIAGTIVKPVAGVQSSQWDPAEMENDTSVSNILKGNF